MSERVPTIRVTAMPADTNPYGGVFGGWLMGQMGLACGSFASRHSGHADRWDALAHPRLVPVPIKE